MIDRWIQNEWQDLCQRLHRCADYQGSELAQDAAKIDRQAAEFCAQQAPERYPDLLQRVRSAANLAKSWRLDANAGRNHSAERESESVVDETLDETFPASDPPSWTTAAI